MAAWAEVGDRVFARRYDALDQEIGAIVGSDEIVVVDTRSHGPHARELQDDLRSLKRLPWRRVVNTHGHWDHCFGNALFRPAEIWAHDGCAGFLRRTGEAQRRSAGGQLRGFDEAFAEVVIDPPDRTFTRSTVLDLGDRLVVLSHLGRGHTDHDIIVEVPDAGVLFAGDLVEEGAPPWFGDSYPLDWPDTLTALMARAARVIVPGHGAVVGPAFVASQLDELRLIADVSRQGHAAGVDWHALVDRVAYPKPYAGQAVARAYAQLDGAL